MKFLANENIDKPIVDRLRKDGHAILYVIEMEPGITDNEVMRRANKESALLLTTDKDFGEIVFRQGTVIHGVVLVRLAGLSPQRKADIVTKVIQEQP